MVPSGQAGELDQLLKPLIKPLVVSWDDLQPELQRVPQGLVDLQGDDSG